MFMKSNDSVFFDLFTNTVKITLEAAELLYNLMKDFTDVPEKIKKIEEKEHECDKLVHDILENLNKSFITPIDREDIYCIAKELDNITDSIESTAHAFNMYNVTEIKPESLELAKLGVDSVKALLEVVSQLNVMKKKNTIYEKVVEVNKIEDDADNIFRESMAKLFTKETNPIEILRWKNIYQYLENTLDACEDVANIVEGIVMKHV